MVRKSETGADDWLVLGKLTSPYGVKGWIKVYSYTDPMENIATYRPLWMVHNGKRSQLEVLEIKKHGKGLVMSLKDCTAREQAALLNGAELVVPRDDLKPLEPGDYYWSQLIGLQVITTADEHLGTVYNLLETGSNDVLKVRGTSDSIDQKERLIPYLPDSVVLDIDLASGTMRVDWDADF